MCRSCQGRRTVSTTDCGSVSTCGHEEKDPWFICLADKAGRNCAASLGKDGVWLCCVSWSEFGNLGQSRAVERETQRYLETVAPKSSSREEQIATAGRLQGPVKGEQSPPEPCHGAGKGAAGPEARPGSGAPLCSSSAAFVPADALLVGLPWARL